jgi:glycosyltransferase involved in cell wall biosynthesis
MKKLVTILIPAYNEEEVLDMLLEQRKTRASAT